MLPVISALLFAPFLLQPPPPLAAALILVADFYDIWEYWNIPLQLFITDLVG